MTNFRDDFAFFRENELVYFDNAATTQRPDSVIEATENFYRKNNANPLRGLYELGIRATEEYEKARETVRRFINAGSTKEIVFTRNTTEGINLVAYSYALERLKAGDEIVVTIMEHHSNILPWQMVCKKTGAVLKYLYCDNAGVISEEEIEAKITDRTRIVAVTRVSNVLGQETPLQLIIEKAHEKNAIVLVDGAQSVPHMPTDVEGFDIDFLVFSGHKMLAPMGIGVLYGKEEFLQVMEPFLTGGEMIDSVKEQSAVFAELPHKFEAGTVNAGGAVGLAAAIEYIEKIGFDVIQQTERELTDYMMNRMLELPEIEIVGSRNPKEHYGIVAFNVKDVHPHDTVSILDEDGIALRAGHHCAQPLLNYLGVPSSARASLYFYNTREEVDKFIASIGKIREVMGFES